MVTDELQNSGLYQAGTSPLHRMDVRLKLGLLLLLIFSLFAAPGPVRLSLLVVLAVAAVRMGGLSLRQLLSKLLMLRWLLLFGLLLHLFFTPGRTLFGTSWLSYDGLLRGVQVDLQLLLAMTFSYLLALSSAPVDLAWALSRLLSPLERLGLPTREAGGLLILVLHFLPLVRCEAQELLERERPGGMRGRVQAAVGLLGPLLVTLIDRADRLAQQMVARQGRVELTPGAAAGRLGVSDRLVLCGAIIFFPLLWMF